MKNKDLIEWVGDSLDQDYLINQWFVFHIKLKRVRLSKGITQTQLAKMSGVSRNSISSIETGIYKPSAVHAALICSALGCKFEDVFELLEIP